MVRDHLRVESHHAAGHGRKTADVVCEKLGSRRLRHPKRRPLLSFRQYYMLPN